MPVRKWRGRKSDMRGSHNTRRENRLEELGRVDAEKAYTSKGKKNLKQEKSRIRKELKEGGSAKLTPAETRRKAGPSAARPVPKSLRDRLKDLYKKREGKQSPGRPGGKGPKPDKRWDKGDKFMTPVISTQRISDLIDHHKRGKNPGSLAGRGGKEQLKKVLSQKTINTLLKSGRPKIAKKGWK